MRQPGRLQGLPQLSRYHLAVRDRDGEGRAAPLDFDGRRRAARASAGDVQRTASEWDVRPNAQAGAILLGNGGDNSNGSQGTFYEGAVTAAGTFPTDETDRQVQANIVAAGYGVLPVSVVPASEIATPPGL